MPIVNKIATAMVCFHKKKMNEIDWNLHCLIENKIATAIVCFHKKMNKIDGNLQCLVCIVSPHGTLSSEFAFQSKQNMWVE